MKISEITTEKNIISSRVNTFIYTKYKEGNIPFSIVIEASLVYFLKLNTNEKVKFISENSIDTVEESNLNLLSTSFTEELEGYLKEMKLSQKIISTLLGGSIVTLISIIAGALQFNGKNEEGEEVK